MVGFLVETESSDLPRKVWETEGVILALVWSKSDGGKQKNNENTVLKTICLTTIKLTTKA